jgi:hypothetical protein
LYFSSQRGTTLDGRGLGRGVTFEVTGPFRTQRVGVAALGSSGRPEPLAPSPAPAEPDSGDARAESAPADTAATLPATGGGLGVASLAAVGLAAVLRRRRPGPTE